MYSRLRSRKRVSSINQFHGDFEVSPPKKMMEPKLQRKVYIYDLPEKAIHVVLSHCNLSDLGTICHVSHQFNNHVISFLHTNYSIPVLFPSMKVVTEDHNTTKYFISSSEKKYGFGTAANMISYEAVANFKQLGTLIKKMTCLLPTRERVIQSTKLMSRLSPCSSMSRSSDMMSLCGIYLHQIVKGWTDNEVLLAAQLIYLTFNGGNEGCVSIILAPGYILGSRPDVEMHVRNFLSSVFYKEAASGQKSLWLETLLHQTGSIFNISVLARVLLLMSSPAKEEGWQFGVQWPDHVEAIPATLAVASSRYHFLVCLMNTLRNGQHNQLFPSTLSAVFHTPSPWLPENVGSVLLLLGSQTCYLYLQYLVNKVVNRNDVCTNCFKDVSIAIAGLALMTARFRWSFAPTLARMEEVVMQVPEEQKKDILRAIWKALAEEVTDIRQAVGEDWAEESSLHLFKVIRLIGQRMTEKAFMKLPGPAPARDSNIEE